MGRPVDLQAHVGQQLEKVGPEVVGVVQAHELQLTVGKVPDKVAEVLCQGGRQILEPWAEVCGSVSPEGLYSRGRVRVRWCVCGGECAA